MSQTRANPWLIAFIVSIAAFMEVLDTTITNVSLQHIAGSLGAGQDESTWVLTSYLVANGIILPLSGWLSDVMGRKRFFTACILGFTVASFFCGAATSLASLIIFRILQGAAGGGLQPTQQAIVLDSFPPERRGVVFAITGITMIAAPIIGPTLGGLITDSVSWRWIFYINVPVGLIAAFLVWRLVDDPPEAKPHGFSKIDYMGVGLVGLGIAALQLVLDKGQQNDWFGSPFIVIWALISFVSLVAAVIWLWGQKEPIIDLSLFKDKAFAASCVLIFLTGFMLYGGSTLIPLLLQTQYGYSATLAGLILSPGGIAVVILMPVVGILVGKIQARYLTFIGLALSALGLFLTTRITPQTNFTTFVWLRVAQGVGLPFLFISISTLAFMNVPKNKSNKASALFALARNIGGSFGISIVETYQAQHAQIQQHHFVEHLIPGAPNYQTYLNAIQSQVGSLTGALANIYNTLQTQATIISYADTFMLISGIMVAALCFALLVLPSNRPGTGAPSAGHG